MSHSHLHRVGASVIFLSALLIAFDWPTCYSADCDPHGVPAAAEIEDGETIDCNGNGVPDICEVASGQLDFEKAPDLATFMVEHGAVFWTTSADFDGDDDFDLMTGGQIGLVPFENLGGEVFEQLETLEIREHSPHLSGLVSGDLDGDQDMDVVGAVATGGASTHLAAFVNEGGWNFRGPILVHLDVRLNQLVAEKLDEDDFVDLAFVHLSFESTLLATYHVAVALSAGDGTFAPRVDFPIADDPAWFTTVDVDNDDDLDFAIVSGSQQHLEIHVNDGKGSFSRGSVLELPVHPQIVASGELGGGQESDLAIVGFLDRERHLIRLKNQGQGDFTQVGAIEPLPVRGLPIGLAIDDLDGDGRVDIAALSSLATVVRWRLEDGSFAPPQSFPGTDASYSAALRDFNDDGTLDVATAPGWLVSVSYLRSNVNRDCNGNGIPDDCDLQAVGADADGDGILDECAGIRHFLRGDANADVRVDLADPMKTLFHLFGTNVSVACEDSADTDDNGQVNVADAVYALRYLFGGGDAPLEPGPVLCGADPTDDGLRCGSYVCE